jgi:tetratricopeptide (TPR) repeat protein
LARPEDTSGPTTSSEGPADSSGLGSGWAFVGRGGELAQLARGLDDAVAGRGRLFVLMGEPGIGKTSLCDEAAAAAAARGVPVLWGRAWEAGGAPAYWPWLDLLAGLARQLDDAALSAAIDDEGAPLIAELVPEIRRRLPPAAVAAPPPADEARFRLWRAVVALVRRAAAATGLVLVFDDLHSADRSSLLLLYALARELRSARVLLVATCRDVEARLDPETSELISRVAREGTTLKLGRLNRADAGDLMRRRAGTLDADVERRIFASAQGNPLFLVEMVRLLDDEGSASIAAGVVPAGVRDVIRQRLDRVAEEARALLNLAAVAGDEPPPALLAAAAARDEVWVSRQIAETVRAGVLVERGGRPRFSHALVREVLYRELPDAERRTLHGAVGDALERLSATAAEPPLMELAHHALEASASHLSRAVAFAVRAAARATAVSAPEEAVAVLERARTAVERGGNPAGLRAEVLLALAEARIRWGDVVPGKSLCCEVATLARQLEAPALLARAALAYGRVFNFAVVDPVLVDLLENALAALPSEDSAVRARLLARLAGALQPSNDTAEPVRVAHEAIATARRLGDRRALLETMFDGLSALMDVVDPRERRALNLEVEALTLAEGDRERLLRTHARLAIDHLALGELGLCDARIDAFEALAEELQASWILWRVPLFRAVRATMHGRFTEAAAFEEQARELAGRVRDPQSERACVLLHEGLLRTAERHDEMRAFDAHARHARALFSNGQAWQSLGSALMFTRLEDQAQARFHFELVPDEVLPPNKNRFALGVLAESVAFVGPPAVVEAMYALLLPVADQYAMLGMTQMQWEGPVARVLGLLAARLGRSDEAVAHLDDALARVRRLDARPLVARTCYELGRALGRRGHAADEARARALFKEARALAGELTLPGLLRLLDAGDAGDAGVTAAEARDVRAPPRAAGAPAPTVAVAPAPSVMVLEGEYWTLAGRAGRSFSLKDSLGLRYLARLLAEPGREIHVLELAAGVGAEAEDRPVDSGDAGELLDDEARADYRRRLDDLRDTLAEAESFGDAARAARAREEIDFLAAELGRAVGLGGRARRAGSAAERARSAVQRRIKNALARIGEADPELGSTLARAVRTGNYCVYRTAPA